jgi:alpha-glucosidase
MQRTAEAGAGFTTGRPWLPIADDARTVNVEEQRRDPTSMLALHQRLLELRRREPALAVGDYGPIFASAQVLAFERRHVGREIAIVLNLTDTPAKATLPTRGSVLVDTGLTRAGERVGPEIDLAENEGVIIELTTR